MTAVEEQTVLSIDVIRTDGGTQPRAEVDQDVIRDYAQQMFEGVQFPPVTVYYDGTDYWLADGFHRYYAAKQQCKDILYADVRQGTRRDAVLFSVGANATHGLRRSNLDKHQAIKTLLNDPEWTVWSDNEIARKTHTSAPLVARLRLTINSYSDSGRTFITKHGTIATMNTTNIGPQPSLTEREASLASYRDYDKWQEAQRWGTKQREVEKDEPDTEPELPAYTPPRYEAPTWTPTMPPSPVPTPAPMPASLYGTYTEEDEEQEEETEEDRYQTAIDMGTIEYYYDGLVRDAIQRDREEREAKREREERRTQIKERLDQLRERGVDLPKGKYSCLVIDPPWPMQKIERDVRPNQMEFEYPTMTEEELKAFPLPEVAADDCHLYLWTTHKYLPMAFRLAEHWGFKYQCLMTWRKNVGFTPFSWMYSTEHVLFCTKGSLNLLAKGKRLDFEAKVREHSRKPDEFYDLVKEVSPGPRLDIFSREKREDFDQFGNEVDKYDG